MIIDFHTHVFADELADRALSVLVANLEGSLKPVHNGKLNGLIERMDSYGVDISVVQPIVTKQSQTQKINEWAKSICSDRIISFGSIFPHTDNYKRDIDYICDLGLKGIKFHAEYQDFVIDEKNMLDIYYYALSRGLIILHHGGEDTGMPAPYKSSPERFARIADAMQGGVIIAAHLGGYNQWDEVYEKLAGKNIYMDTSMGFEFYKKQQFMRIVEKHGADKILFASDSPWSNAKQEADILKTMPLSAEDIEKILSGNARRILMI